MKKINVKNLEKLEAAIKEAEGRATARTITAEGIVKKLEEISKYLGIPQKKMVGIKVECDINAQKFPKAYKYTPESTIFCAEMFPSGWFVTDIYRDRSWNVSTKSVKLNLTEMAKNAIIEANTEF